MISNNESSLFSLLLRKSIIDPRLILKTCHKNCMYKTDKSFTEVSTQCQTSINTFTDEQTQVSQSNESKNTQTSFVYSPISIKKHQQIISSQPESKIPTNKYIFINPYSIIDRVNQGEEFLKFLYKQNLKLDLIYTNFLKNLQKYTDHFLLSLHQEHCLYGIYRHDIIRYIIILQEQINELRTKVNVLQETNKNFFLFQKHFHKIIQNKSQLEDLLTKHEKYLKQGFYQKESGKYQQKFFEIYQKSYIQLRTIEQQRLLAIREQMRFVIDLTIPPTDECNLFTSNNFDDLINTWEHQHIVSIDRWSHFPHRSIKSQHDISLILLDEIKQIVDEYYNHQSINSNNKHTTLNRISDQLKTIDNSNEEFLKRMDSITSNITQSYFNKMNRVL